MGTMSARTVHPGVFPSYRFQAILIEVGAGSGDFDLEFNQVGAIPAGAGSSRSQRKTAEADRSDCA
jgi:hypothetical protein